MISQVALPKNDLPAEYAEFFTRESVLRDFEICCISREVSLLSRKEVLTGKAKFGITGDGKELPQVAMAHAFKKGDFRSGYYRDQTLLLALGICSVEDLFAQLYADPVNDPFSGGRQMNSHFATPLVDASGQWLAHTQHYNISADLSSTAGQMARALGLALASKKYRKNPELDGENQLSAAGNEVVFCTIGDASTSEGIFWETLNAAAVMQAPLAVSVWDDGYGISVPTRYQTTKGSISEALAGMEIGKEGNGIHIHTVEGWNYPQLIGIYQAAIQKVRESHVPALFHVRDLTQPQGHSTSGSHERYKSKERLQWERDSDCIITFGHWIVEAGLADQDEIDEIKNNARQYVKDCREKAWKAFNEPASIRKQELLEIYHQIPQHYQQVEVLREELAQLPHPLFSEIVQNGKRLYYALLDKGIPASSLLARWLHQAQESAGKYYHTQLYSSTPKRALEVPEVKPVWGNNPLMKNGYEILNSFFDKVLERYPEVFAFGEDVGNIGDVNQCFAGLQKKYGEERVFDTGIREWSIIGQAIGMAMRGLRPIAEIQYLDYLLYGISPLSDDLATLRYRSNGKQGAPAIIRTRGHRLEGIWHAGSPMGMIIHALRGIYVLTPRNMTQAAGFYNTLLQSDDPALVVECLNGYRLKEPMPENIGEYTVPLGIPEIMQEGDDITLVTYGSCVRVAQAGIELLARFGISVELIDVQSLLPFDIHHLILESIQKTGRVIFMDEDVPGGATAYMQREVLETQGGFRYLDSPPRTLTAHSHRPPYGSDGDYFSKPNPEDVFELVYRMMYEAEPERFPGSLDDLPLINLQ